MITQQTTAGWVTERVPEGVVVVVVVVALPATAAGAGAGAGVGDATTVEAVRGTIMTCWAGAGGEE